MEPSIDTNNLMPPSPSPGTELHRRVLAIRDTHENSGCAEERDRLEPRDIRHVFGKTDFRDSEDPPWSNVNF